MRGLGGVVLVVWLVAACSGSTKKNGTTGESGGSGATAGTTGDGGSTGATAGSSSTGAAGSSGDDASAGAGGEGVDVIQGLPGQHHPDCEADCGGSPVGDWIYTGATSCNLIPTSGGTPEPEECTILLLPNPTPSFPDEPPVRLERPPRFDFSGQPLDSMILMLREDGSYTFATFYKGMGHMQLAAQCRKLGENIVECAHVAAAVEPSLIGEGTGRNFTCVDNAEGGCDCSYEVNLAGGPAGVWRTTPEGKLVLQPSNQQPDAPKPLPATYCADETLALGPELRIPGQPTTGEPTVFARLDCTDGVKGPGEEDVDCGLACPVPCSAL